MFHSEDLLQELCITQTLQAFILIPHATLVHKKYTTLYIDFERTMHGNEGIVKKTYPKRHPLQIHAVVSTCTPGHPKLRTFSIFGITTV